MSMEAGKEKGLEKNNVIKKAYIQGKKRMISSLMMT